MKTLNEQIGRIKSMMGLIMEDDSLLTNFYNQGGGFFNCRGIRLTLTKDKIKSQKQYVDKDTEKLDKKYRKEDEKEFENIKKQNNLNIDYELYTILKDDALKVKNINSNNTYNQCFDENGKPFTKNLTQIIAFNIQTLLKNSQYYLYWRNIFGNKTPSFMDLYNYVQKDLGGNENFMKVVNNNYNVDIFIEKFNQSLKVLDDKLESMFPFSNPEKQTAFYIIWYDDKKLPKFRYFNIYEEWKFAINKLKELGVKFINENENGSFTSGSAQSLIDPTKFLK